MNPRRLYRCRHDRVLAGVASGMAEYLELDPTVVRVLWILSAFFGGITILLYIVLAFIMPLEPLPAPAPGSPGGGQGSGQDGTALWGPSAAASAEGEVPAQPGVTYWTHQHGERRGSGRAGLYLGVVLVVFGAIAMAQALAPAWIGGAWVGAGLLVAIGVALLVGATRPSASDR